MSPSQILVGAPSFHLLKQKYGIHFWAPPIPPFLQHSTSDLSGNVLWQILLKIHLWYDYFSAPFLISFRFKPPSFHTWITELIHVTIIMVFVSNHDRPPPPKVCYQHSSQSDPLKCKWHHANPLLKTLQIPLSFTQIEFLSARYYIICLFSAFSNLFFSSFLNPYIYTQFPVSLMVKTQHFHCGGLGSVSFGELRSLKPCQVAKNK